MARIYVGCCAINMLFQYYTTLFIPQSFYFIQMSINAESINSNRNSNTSIHEMDDGSYTPRGRDAQDARTTGRFRRDPAELGPAVQH